MAPGSESRKRSSLGSAEEQASGPSQVRRRLSSDGGPSTTFHGVLAGAGCIINSPGAPVLACEHRSVVHQLEQRLKSDTALTAKFLDCFVSFTADETNLRRILLPMVSTAKDGSSRSCDSLAKVLLSVRQTQSLVAASLLEKLPEYVGEMEGDGFAPLLPLMDSIPRLILSQFRWLEFLMESTSLTEKILEILSICPLGLKKEIITFLPEVIVDADHELVVQALETMLQDDMQLIVPVLDAFSNLNLEETLFQQVVSLAINSLRSADVEDLPLVVKFLLQSATGANVKEVVQKLRQNLHFVTIGDVRATKPDRKMKGKSTATNCEALVLEAIRSGLRFQNLILEASLKEIRAVEGEKNHKVIDIWLLIIIHANGGPHRKIAEQLLVKKIRKGDISDFLLRQCIQNRGESLQDYFQTLVCISESCVRSKESVTRQFGMNSYVLLFQEFVEPYYQQEVCLEQSKELFIDLKNLVDCWKTFKIDSVFYKLMNHRLIYSPEVVALSLHSLVTIWTEVVLGALISHIGSGDSLEIGSALETLLVLATNHSQDLLPVSSFINGVLDHLESLQDNNLHQVYKIFSQLAVAAWSSGGFSSGSSIASELLIVVRKQITHSEAKYRRMGIIGAVGLAACLSQEKVRSEIENGTQQGSNTEETISLLQMTSEACKSSSLSRGFFYDELTSQVQTAQPEGPLIGWISKHTNPFESMFLDDLEGGELQTAHDFGALEGELWMNLDKDNSPIVVNILPILMKDAECSSPLMFLPANFRLLAAVEAMTNQGSLGNIDALLGCPMLLPKHQFLVGESWKKFSNHQKKIGCLALFYAINWIRELINAFSTQADRGMDSANSAASKQEIIVKLFKRVRNLMFLEYCLGQCLESTKISFQAQHFLVNSPIQPTAELKPISATQDVNKSRAGKQSKAGGVKRKGRPETRESQKGADVSTQGTNGNSSRQPTIVDAFTRSNGAGAGAEAGAGAVESSTPIPSRNDNPSQDGGARPQSTEGNEVGCESFNVQRWKFRPLTLSSLNILASSQPIEDGSCCLDSAGQLPLFLYLLQDLQSKLDDCLHTPPRKLAPWMNAPALPKAPSGLEGMSGITVLTKLTPLYPSLRQHLDCSISVLQSDVPESQQNVSCDEHWVQESLAAGNPHDEGFSAPTKEAAQSLFVVMIRCLSKVFSYPQLTMPINGPLLKTILSAFGSEETETLDLEPPPAPGSLEEAFCSTYDYLDKFSEAAFAFFSTSTELMVAIKALVNCAEVYVDKCKDDSSRQRSSSDRSVDILPYLRTRLGLSAGRVLGYNWGADDWKNKGDILQQLLRMQIQNSRSPVELLEELVSSVMPQVPSKGQKVVHGSVSGYPALSSGTFMVWYRVEHEEVLDLFSAVVKDFHAQSKLKTSVHDDFVVTLLARAQQCVSLHVALVNFTKTHDKTSIHAMAVKFGGKFVDTFLKGIDFLKSHYDAHKESINALVKELQKATRIVQTLCSEAKGHKRMPVTCKVPVVKRSMERYVYCVKELLHCTSHGSSFWMGNLKHKDLQGREISSQPCGANDTQMENEASENDDNENENNVDEET